MSNIEVQDLTVKYGEFVAVKGVSLSVEAGEIVGIFGSNGAGKSSLLRTMGGVVPASSGKVVISGYDLSNAAEIDTARLLIGYSPDVGGIVASSTISEHLRLALTARGMMQLMPQALELVEAYKLLGHLDVKTAGFSHGQSRNLSVLLATLVSQTALILDEPFDGVDANHTMTTMRFIRDAKRSGLSVIISTHMRERLAEISDRIVVMYGGKIVGTGPASDFRGPAGEQHYRAILAQAALDAGEEAPKMMTLEEEMAAFGTSDESLPAENSEVQFAINDDEFGFEASDVTETEAPRTPDPIHEPVKSAERSSEAIPDAQPTLTNDYIINALEDILARSRQGA